VGALEAEGAKLKRSFLESILRNEAAPEALREV
jgi:hypothetical protein